MNILRVENLSKDFSGLQVLFGVNLEISEGERHAIIGPNGAGKSTLFNIITGLYRPSNGKIFFLDKDITGWPVHKIARSGVSRSFQITSIFPQMTVFENVRNAIISKHNLCFNLTTLVNSNKRVNKESELFIDQVGLAGLYDVPASDLSHGEQRQLELALTLARDPILVLLDEPTAGLTAEESRKAVELIRSVTEGRTLVIVEHDMEVVFSISDRITVLNDGTVLVTGLPDQIRDNEKVKMAYLGRE